jgi:hypothetical protein
MTQKQENALSTWAATDAVLAKYEPVWSALPGFAANVASFRRERQLLDPDAARQQQGTTGIGSGKRATKEELAAAATQMAGNIHVWADNHNHIELAERVDYAEKELSRQRDNVLPVTAANILKLGKEYRKDTNLDTYGVNDASIKELEDLLGRYDGKNASTRVAKSEQKTATVNVAQHIAAGNHYLELLDKLIGNFLKGNPDFVSDYHNARILIDLGSRSDKKSPVAH